MTQQDHNIILAMQKYGGSFAQAIAHAATRADSSNYAKLKAAFPELWETHAKFVRQELVDERSSPSSGAILID